jgi:DNA-binding LytR/AlgR family response regulator/tetratricopeptide (TPR) repeat protein
MQILKNFISIFCACIVSFSNAQDITPLSTRDSSNVLISLASDRLKTSPRESEHFLRQAYRLATSANHPQGKARALFLLASIQKDENRIAEAVKNYLEAALLYETIGDSTGEGRCYHRMASIYIYQLNNYARGYQYCIKAVALLAKDSINLPSARSNLASLHLQTGKFDEALLIYRASYEDERKNNSLRGMCLALNNIATVYDYKKDYPKSYLYYEQALAIAQTMNDSKTVSHILIGMSPVQCQMGNHIRASQLSEQALSIARENGFTSTQISALCQLGLESCDNKNFEQAKRYMLEAEELSNRHNLPVFKREIYDILTTASNKLGNEAEAIRYRKKQTHFIDSMANQERLAVTEIADEKNKIDDRASIADITLPMKAGTLALGFVLVLAGVSFVFYKAKKERGNGSLETGPSKVSTQNAAKEKFVGTDRHLEVLHGEGVKLLPLKDISWFKKDGKLYQAVTSGAQYRVRQNITELEALLTKTNFFRINRSVIINMDQMQNYSFWENHKYIVRMKDSARTQFVISRNRLREMKEAFQVIEGG